MSNPFHRIGIEHENKIKLSQFADKDAPHELNLCVSEGYGHRFDRAITTQVDIKRHRKAGGKNK